MFAVTLAAALVAQVNMGENGILEDTDTNYFPEGIALGDVDLNGSDLILDADGNSKIDVSADELAVDIGGTADVFKVGTSGATVLAGKTLALEAYDDIVMTLAQARVPAADYPGFSAFPSGAATLSYLFDDSKTECLDTSAQLPHDYAQGTPLYLHLHWSPLTTSTNAAVWTAAYTVAGIGVAFPAATTCTATDAGDGVANGHQIVDLCTITCATCTISSVIQVHLCRTGAAGGDTMVGDVAGHSLDAHYRVDVAGGSRTATAK